MKLQKLLVVDDEPTNLALMRTILRDDYELVFATNGEEAIAAANKHLPDLVLCDIHMPQIDGYQVCESLKNDPITRHIPLIFITSLDGEWNEERGFHLGCVDYITKPISPNTVRARVRAHLAHVHVDELKTSHFQAIHMLGAAGHHNDTDTGVHIWRMAEYARCLAELLNWDSEDCRLLQMAATMHDTGKIGIPAHILQKNGPLSEEEWEVMRQHPQMGYDILIRSQAPVFKLAACISLEHHEKWDGSGYPNQLTGDAIAIHARIVAIVDVFDALTTARPYKDPWPIEKATDLILDQSDKHFDPALVQTFLDHLDIFKAIKKKWDAVDKDTFQVFEF